ncbi:aldehyde dehydrogenase [Armatimonadota bacterium]|nr:aldehyde dehydrogenase [Armatimonadota bacterium]
MATQLPSHEKRVVSRSPITEEVLAECLVDSYTQVFEKVNRSRAASEHWQNTPLHERLTYFVRLRSTLAERAESVARVLSAETGRPLQESLGAEVLPTLHNLDYLIQNAGRILRSVRLPQRRGEVFASPYGVIGSIGTWNYPLFLNLVPLCQALAVGNTVVWKPSEYALYTAATTIDLFESIGLPQDVLQAVWGDGQAGRYLAQAGCDKYAFVGSARTGRAILSELAVQGKPSVMELSGNDASIVCKDAPLEAAARSVIWGRVCNAGQSCVAPQRVYVIAEVYEAFLEQCVKHITHLRLHELTPLRTAVARERCHRLVDSALTQGARLLHGGAFDLSRGGYYYLPTLLADCREDMEIVAEEVFAPVVCVCRVADESEAICRANSTDFGLGASVWTQDLSSGRRIASELQVGLVSINSVLLDAADPTVSFGGVSASGFGKQRGALGLEEFIVRKAVVAHSAQGVRRHLFPYLPATEGVLKGIITLRSRGGWRTIPELLRSANRWREEMKAFQEKA